MRTLFQRLTNASSQQRVELSRLHWRAWLSIITVMRRALGLGFVFVWLGCRDGKHEDLVQGSAAPGSAAQGSTARVVAASKDEVALTSKLRPRPPIEILDVSGSVVSDADREGLFTALEVRFTARAEAAVDSTDAEISIWAKCPTPDRWESIFGETRIYAMALDEARPMTIVVAGPRNIRRIPAFCGLQFVFNEHPRSRRVMLAELHWDGTQVLPGPPPSLARKRQDGPSAQVHAVSATGSPDTLPTIGGPLTGPQHVRLRFRVTPLRPLEDSTFGIVGTCTFPDGTRRQGRTTTKPRTSERGEMRLVASLFMFRGLDLPTRCDLVFELHRGSKQEIFPELLARTEVEVAEADLR